MMLTLSTLRMRLMKTLKKVMMECRKPAVVLPLILLMAQAVIAGPTCIYSGETGICDG